ncbi:MAG: DUF3343 domain-containing protein [Defluviitaleaceae bacterium]|nr:DUF3343 domain-containing protein [Defluviitaleaceae bacterium]
MEYIITFTSTSFAMKAEKTLIAQKLQVGVLPLPSQISAGCGLCLRIKPKEIQPAMTLLLDAQLGEVGLYSRLMENGRYVYQPVKSIQTPL